MPIEIASLLSSKNKVIQPLKEVLFDCGYEIPDNPLHEETYPKPRQWLVRAESSKSRLMVENDRVFVPHPGDWYSYGVFLGDCLTPLMFPEKGAYYVFSADSICQNYLPIPSDGYYQQIEIISEKRHLSLKNISDVLEVELQIFKDNPIYQHRRGIVTYPCNLSVTQAERIILTEGFLDQSEIELLPPELRNKMVLFSVN